LGTSLPSTRPAPLSGMYEVPESGSRIAQEPGPILGQASSNAWGSGQGMSVVGTIAKIGRAYFQDKKSIQQICRELRVSRNTVRKVIR